jgi:Zn-dependent protease with chaperone function
VGVSIGISLEYSRLHESEADELGLMIAANAGFDPLKAIGLWERMASESGRRPEVWRHRPPGPAIGIHRIGPCPGHLVSYALWVGGIEAQPCEQV